MWDKVRSFHDISHHIMCHMAVDPKSHVFIFRCIKLDSFESPMQDARVFLRCVFLGSVYQDQNASIKQLS